MCECRLLLCFFFFNDTATTEIYTLSLHDALPISYLEEELEFSVREKGRERHLPIIRKLLGWDGGTGTTCEAAAREFGLTRERVRQIVRAWISRLAGEKAVLLHRAIRFIARRAPAMANELEAALVHEGIMRTPFRLESLWATACWSISIRAGRFTSGMAFGS